MAKKLNKTDVEGGKEGDSDNYIRGVGENVRTNYSALRELNVRHSSRKTNGKEKKAVLDPPKREKTAQSQGE